MTDVKTRGIFGANWTNVFVGLVILATPFFTGETATVPYWNSIVVGLIVAALAAWNMYAARTGHKGQVIGTSLINLLAGIWLVALPFVYTTEMAYRWVTVIEGAVLLFVSGYVTWAAGKIRGVIPGRPA